MKKYKLLKELPGLEVGTMFTKNSLNSFPKYQKHILEGLLDSLSKTDWLEEIDEKSIYELEEGDKYYYIDDIGEIIEERFYDRGELEKLRREIGNVFLTKQEAEKELNKRKALTHIKKWIWENKIELSKYGFILLSDFNSGIKIVEVNRIIGVNDIIFKKKEQIEKCLEECKEQWEVLFDLKEKLGLTKKN